MRESVSRRKIIMMMFDGFGIPPEGWEQSIYGNYCSKDFIELFRDYSIPLDACLGVEGIPQSATGQCSLFCGVNAPEYAGCHMHAFPGKELRQLIRERNIFKAVKAKGLKPIFANAYVSRGLEELENTRFRSVTTVMTASAIGKVFRSPELIAGKAVFHDVTNESAPEEFNIPVISPEQAGHNLIGISREYDFTLFEFFLTDRGGHKTNRALLPEILGRLDRFTVALHNELPDDTLLVISSDHGNCEDLSTHIHTLNPVPLLVYGKERPENITTVKSIDQVYDFILNLF
ncbi:MAG: hypothetical protein JXR78_08075 [Victivallales bacterium]|nr:hypothetical protein [Victivallales bacterium]